MNKKTRKIQKRYTLYEVKEKYFPNRDLSSLTNRDEDTLTKEAFMNILKKISTPVKQAEKEKKET
jgi:hypothetical protein